MDYSAKGADNQLLFLSTQESGVIAKTNRLTLRELQLADAAFALRLYNEPSFLQHIGDKGCIIVHAFVPVIGAGLQGFVIGLLGVGDQLFDTDIFANDIAGTV